MMYRKLTFIVSFAITITLSVSESYAKTTQFKATYQGEIGNKPFILHLNVNGQDVNGFYMYLSDNKTINLEGKLHEESGRVTLDDGQKKPVFFFDATLGGKTIKGNYKDIKSKNQTAFYASDLRGEYSTGYESGWYSSFIVSLGTNGYEIQMYANSEYYHINTRLQNDSIIVYDTNWGVEFTVTDNSFDIIPDKEYQDIYTVLNKFQRGKKVRFMYTNEFIGGDSFIEFPEKDENGNPAKEIKLSDKYWVQIKRIPKSDYFIALWKSGYKPDKYKKITDVDKAKSMLKKRVEFYKKNDPEDNFYYANTAIQGISFKDGEKAKIEEHEYPFFVAYYPEIDILVTEGGHSSDNCFDLKDSKNTHPGNPRHYYTSPDKKLRLNGAHDGQDCIVYFLEEWDKPSKAYKIIDSFPYDANMCYAEDCFWYDNNTLIYKTFTGSRGYCELKINTYPNKVY